MTCSGRGMKTLMERFLYSNHFELFSSHVNHASYKADYWLFFACFEVRSQLPTSQWSAFEQCRAIFTGVKIDSTKIIHGFLSMHLKNGAIHCGPEVWRSKPRMIWLATKADRRWEINWIHCALSSLLSITLLFVIYLPPALCSNRNREISQSVSSSWKLIGACLHSPFLSECVCLCLCLCGDYVWAVFLLAAELT